MPEASAGRAEESDPHRVIRIRRIVAGAAGTLLIAVAVLVVLNVMAFRGRLTFTQPDIRGGQDAAPFLAEDLFERRYQYTSERRISTAPP